MSNLTEDPTSLTVAENSVATAILIAAPSDPGFTSAQLTVTVTALPTDGTVLLADGVTPVTLGETLTVAQLTALRFRPGLNSFGLSSSFAFTVSDPAGNTVAATATLAIGASNAPVVTSWATLTAPANAPATPIGIAAPSDANFAASQLSVKVTALPTDGTVLLADGVTAVTVGQTLTVAQLSGLEFRPSGSSGGRASAFTYSVTDPAGNSAAGSVLLQVAADTPPVTTAAALVVAQNSAATPIGIAAPTDANFAASALSVRVTALPADGTVVLSDGVTAVSVSQSLTVAQLTGLEFKPTTGAFGQNSTFAYSVSDPTGASASGNAALSIGASNTPLVTTPRSLTVAENSGAAPIGLAAPSGANFAASQLSVTVTALPTDGTVLLSNGTTPVVLGQSLTVAQLSGLEFKPAQDNTGKSSSFAYTVSDPAGHTANGSATLTTGPNPIVLENEKPGVSPDIWQVDPGQDSTQIQGFTTSISTDVGGTVAFKINNQTGNANYQINIYRLGYYGGDGATLVTSINHQSASAVVQPAALVDPTTGLVDAGNWQVTDTWAVPASATSGVYVANVVDGSQVFQIPFIVRNDSSHSDIVFQTSDETWQAYNGWGGANLYGGDGPAPTGAAYAVSYNRPITTRDSSGFESGPQDTVFGAEYAAIYWMEQNGYDVSYISGVDTSTNGALLLNHKIFMDAGHDEYWTDSQAANVQAAANAGVNLTFLSGNEIFWQTRFEPSIAGGGAADRTLVSYKDTHFNTVVDPNGTATGTFEDPRFGVPPKPSNALTGTLFQVDQNSASSTIQIPYDLTQLRFWRNTAVAATTPTHSASLEAGLLGYEWDSSPDNGFMPAGLINLSSTTVQEPTAYNTDFGSVDTSGSATHNLVEYRDPTSGALVFGAGTVFWSWGLSDQHDNSPAPFSSDTSDPNVQQAMVNLLADMGVQPATLQASLVIANQSTDHTAPTSHISSVSSTSVAEGQTVTVSGTAADIGGVIGGVQVSSDGGLTWHPASGQVGTASVSWTYSFTTAAPGTYAIQSRAVDDSLNLEAPGPGVSYTVTPSSALSLFSPSSAPATADAADASAVEVGVKVTSATPGEITGIRFYKGSLNTGVHVGNLWSAGGVLLATATFANETASGWQQVNFSSPVKITAGSTYIASYHTNVGEYSDTPYYFSNYQGQSNGSLTAAGSNLNGVFAYGAGSVFPTNVSVTGDNYWVDVVFNDTVNDPKASDESGITTTEDAAISIPVATILANDTDPLGLALSVTGVGNATNGTVSYDPSAQTVTFTPTTGYTGSAGFTYSISDASGASASGNIALTVNHPAAAQSLFNSDDTPAAITVNDANAYELGVKFQASTDGAITGIRFYKGPQNTGVHVADLWSASGALLATATFTNETASGWQEVDFSNPVMITAGTTYVASYHTNAGDYSANSNYFATAHSNGALTALASGSSGGDGVYAASATPAFPTSTFNAANYWVDVVFNGTSNIAVANPDSGFVTPEGAALSISASALLANDTDAGGNPLSVTGVGNPSNGAATYNPSTQSVSFVPSAGYVGPAGFTYSISDGHGGAASGNVSLVVDYPMTAQSLFFPGDKPAEVTVNDPSAVELGVKLQASTSGTITGIRFYKGPQNTGVHVGDLWSPDGALLATATFANETASGWQEVDFSRPVAVAAGATFVASYHTNAGEYSADGGYFSVGRANGELTAPANAGVFAYGGGPAFPDSTFNATNYWVDAVFNGSPLQPPTAVNDNGFAASKNITLSIPAAALLANDTDPYNLTLSITGVSNPSNGAVTYDAATQTVAFAPTTGYLGPAGFTYTISDGEGGSASANVALTVGLPPPVANADSGFSTTENAALSIPAAALLANDTDPNGFALSIASVGNASNGAVSYDAATQTVSFVPTAGYVGPAGFTYSITDGQGGVASAGVSLGVHYPVTAQSLFNPGDAPAIVTVNDANSVELGVKLAASTDGAITGIRFYKGPQNTGPHTADLWSASGALLATTAFTNETASGWQEADFSTPVAVTPGTTYVAAYHTDGDYSVDGNYFAAAHTNINGALTAPSSASSGGNGVYAYGGSSVFPSNSFNASNYWVDVVFNGHLVS